MKPWGPTLSLLIGATLILAGCTIAPAGSPAPASSASPLAAPVTAAATTAATAATTAAPSSTAPAAGAGAQTPTDPTPVPPAGQPEATPEVQPDTERGDLAAEEQAMPADPAAAGIPGDLLNAVLDDAAQRLGVATDVLVVTRAEAVTWNDGSLGCPEPGMFYTQALIDGYWIVVEAGKEALDYRAQGNGFFRLCDRPQPGSRTLP